MFRASIVFLSKPFFLQPILADNALSNQTINLDRLYRDIYITGDAYLQVESIHIWSDKLYIVISPWDWRLIWISWSLWNKFRHNVDIY